MTGSIFFKIFSKLKDRLQFDQKCRVLYIGDGEAFMLLVGMYITRGLITTVRKPVCLSVSLLSKLIKICIILILYIKRQYIYIYTKHMTNAWHWINWSLTEKSEKLTEWVLPLSHVVVANYSHILGYDMFRIYIYNNLYMYNENRARFFEKVTFCKLWLLC